MGGSNNKNYQPGRWGVTLQRSPFYSTGQCCEVVIPGAVENHRLSRRAQRPHPTAAGKGQGANRFEVVTSDLGTELVQSNGEGIRAGGAT